MEDVLTKIREFRRERGCSYENMAADLDISAAAYRKIEQNETKLTVERLYKIANILEVKLEELLNIKADKFYKQEIHDNGIGHQEVENLYQDNKEKNDQIVDLYEQRLLDKDKQIELLQRMINKV